MFTKEPIQVGPATRTVSERALTRAKAPRPGARLATTDLPLTETITRDRVATTAILKDQVGREAVADAEGRDKVYPVTPPTLCQVVDTHLDRSN